MRRRHYLMLCAVISACGEHDLDRNGAIAVADEYLRSSGPSNVAMPFIDPVATDRGTYWSVKYDLKDGWNGGAPTVEVDKRTRAVLRQYGDQ
jgi:hypothetical protein